MRSLAVCVRVRARHKAAHGLSNKLSKLTSRFYYYVHSQTTGHEGNKKEEKRRRGEKGVEGKIILKNWQGFRPPPPLPFLRTCPGYG